MAFIESEYNRQYREENGERIATQRADYRKTQNYKDWLDATRERRTARETAKSRQRRQSSIEAWFKYILIAAKSRVRAHKNRNLEYAISLDDLLEFWKEQNGLCAVCGLPMNHTIKSLSSASIDRIDSSVGYIRNNVHLVARWVNIAKGDSSLDEIIGIVKAVRASASHS